MLAMLLAAAAAASATLRVTDGWVKAPPPGASSAAGYLTVLNDGRTPDRLTSVTTDAAARAEVHTMDMSGGVMRMRAVSGADVPAGGRLELKPGGGLHLMLTEPRRPLRAGDMVKATLTFQHAGQRTVGLPVRAR